MKTRQGFVSNSSSSSFVLLGFIPTEEEIKKLEEKIKLNESLEEDDDIYEYVYDYLSEKDFYQIGEGDWEGAVGRLISDVSSDSYGEEAEEIDFQTLDEYATKVCEEFGVEKSRIKLYTGTRMC